MAKATAGMNVALAAGRAAAMAVNGVEMVHRGLGSSELTNRSKGTQSL